jgi:hypothetical protein
LLGKDEPALWYEAAAGLPKVEGSKPALSADDSEVLRTRAEQLLEREAQVFEREVQGRNAADARWLSQVRGIPRGGGQGALCGVLQGRAGCYRGGGRALMQLMQCLVQVLYKVTCYAK